MLNDVTAESVAAEIVMLRKTTNRTIFVLEGKGESKIVPHFIASDHCVLVFSYGKSRSVGAIEIVNGLNTEGVLALVDSDFDRLRGKDASSENVVVTDYHDFEGMMFFSPAFDKLVMELAQPEKLANYEGADIREVIIQVASEIGKLRLLSLEKPLNLKFEGMKFRFLDIKLRMSVDAMVTEVINHSQMHHLEAAPIVEYVSAKQLSDDQRREICCGHDLCVVIGRMLQSLLATLSSGSAAGTEIESKMRLAYSYADFVQTSVYERVREWEAKNHPYICLR